jgi:predicted Zn-dependent protease with MMP-like domain
VNREVFERLVAEALDGLPEQIRAHMENVEVMIEEWPSAFELADAGMEKNEREELLGLYSGVPLTERTTTGYAGFLPDRITLFQGPIQRVAGSDAEAIREEVRTTVVHEIGHYFGISEDRLEELGW